MISQIAFSTKHMFLDIFCFANEEKAAVVQLYMTFPSLANFTK
jgi:hypothetical protein